jgi:hypothetical protein
MAWLHAPMVEPGQGARGISCGALAAAGRRTGVRGARRVCYRVVYVDYDPVVLLHARVLLASHDEGLVDYLDADLRDTATILEQASRTLDFSRPVAIMLIAILHAIGDQDDPYESYLALSHVASDIDREQIAEATERLDQLSHQHFTLREHAQCCASSTG